MYRKVLPILFFVAHTSVGFAQQAGTAVSTDDPDKKTAVIGGRLNDASTGEPIRKATLTLTSMPSPGVIMTGPPPSVAAASDADGSFLFSNLEPGTYMLTAERAGYVRQQYGSKNGPFGPGSSITVKGGDKLTSLDFKLPKQAVIAGRVVDEDGEPVANALVNIMRYQPFGRQPQTTGGNSTNDLGEFRIANLTPGRYLIQAQRRGNIGPAPAPAAVPESGKDKQRLDYIPTYYPSATDITTAAPITPASGQQLTGIDIQLKKAPVYQVKGTVSGVTAGTRTQISIQPKTDGRSGMFFNLGGGVTVKQDGTFSVPSVAPGRYDLLAMNFEDGRPAIVGRTEFTVSDANVDNVVISAGSKIDITGRVIADQPDGSNSSNDPSSNKLTGQVALVSASHLPNFSQPGRIQDDGTFKLTGASRDKVFVAVYGLQSNQYVKSVSAGSVDITDTGLDLSTAESAPPIEIRLSAKGATVEGVVLDKDGNPVTGSLVLLLPQPYDPEKPTLPMFRKTGTTDQSGRFSMKAIAPGEYRLYAWDSFISVGDLDPERLKPFEKNAAVVKVEEAGRQTVELRVNAVPPE